MYAVFECSVRLFVGRASVNVQTAIIPKTNVQSIQIFMCDGY